jgi:spermidine/putrescine transport system ATP-binding protein
MRGGAIEQVGPPEEVYERPGTGFVAGFLGASNLLEGTAGPVEREWRTLALDSGETIRVPSASADGIVGRLKVGVRPEKIRIASRATAAPANGNRVEARVVDATFVGVSNVYTVQTRTGHVLTVYAQNVGKTGEVRAGEEVELTWDPIHTFVVSEERRDR